MRIALRAKVRPAGSVSGWQDVRVGHIHISSSLLPKPEGRIADPGRHVSRKAIGKGRGLFDFIMEFQRRQIFRIEVRPALHGWVNLSKRGVHDGQQVQTRKRSQ